MERLTEKQSSGFDLKARDGEWCNKYLLSRLPVPIGTTVYKIEPLAKGAKKYIKTTITRYEVFEDSIWFTFADGLGRNIKDFEKYVFLTQEEAEQKLKEMESD